MRVGFAKSNYHPSGNSLECPYRFPFVQKPRNPLEFAVANESKLLTGMKLKTEEWEEFAPGLKSLEQATEIRRRFLTAYEAAERSDSAADRKRLLTFVIVGGGPTGVELAGAIGEMSRFTLAKDFRNINAAAARVILIETGTRILLMFSESLASRAARDLEQLGVQVWTTRTSRCQFADKCWQIHG